mgnify:CR=1 FL=1
MTEKQKVSIDTIEKTILGEYEVSTVGIPRTRYGVTKFYETAIFKRRHDGSLDHDWHETVDSSKIPFTTNERRYHTEREARIGHEEVVGIVIESLLYHLN